MNFIAAFNHKTLLIPRMQREYVQGNRKSAVIEPFLDALLEKPCDLNYIYGYEEDGCFVPVDGQQRLITLWLLHLYLYARRGRGKEYDIRIKFAAREYAEDFGQRLHEHLEEVLRDKTGATPLDDVIRDQRWFIRSWSKNATVENMLNTLRLTDRKINEGNIGAIWHRIVESPTPGVTFAFLQMDGRNGLDDDIYIKMNGRGRKLSAFENLKSWMDEKVAARPYAPAWKTEMDNEWTDLFWKNRDLSREHPEEIDEAQLHCFDNLMILYHIGSGELKETLAALRENDPYAWEELRVFLDMEAQATETDIADRIIGRLQHAEHIPLLWMERLELMSEGAFDFVFKSIRRITALAADYNALNLYIGDDKRDGTTCTYRVSMREGVLERTLPLLYALVVYEDGATTLGDWMRVMRNLTLGTSINKENIARIMDTIGECAKACKAEDIHTLLADNRLKTTGFARRQADEEVRKSAWIVKDRTWTKRFDTLESTAFCKGSIGFVFGLLPHGWDEQIFEEYATLCHLMFGSKGVRYNIRGYNLQRSLMCHTSHYGFGYPVGDKWKFMQEREEWHRFLNDTEEHEGQPHNHCMRLLISRLHEHLRQTADLSRYEETYSRALNDAMEAVIAETLEKNEIQDWRKFFIRYPEVWDVMGKSMCRWAAEYDIYVLGSSRWRNGNIRELRAFAFLCDIRREAETDPETYKAWQRWGFWCYGDTCMYMDHRCRNGRVVAIDVFYERGCAEGYRFRIFYRPPEEAAEATRTELADTAERHALRYNEQEHKYLSGCHSYNEARRIFGELRDELGER